ncbi:hypothetical protein BN1200_420006 [Klebsiella variicola]|nr:hypothetical protein BN1200_380141 [Klebsiella variicola]CTQ12311.1 hypothetical protein BN1200_420006 [Klebsiella variicola]CTQ20105.1 hypothetical protein BN1007_80318 [Klebsiella variicola]
MFCALPPSGSQFTVPNARLRAIVGYMSNAVLRLIFAARRHGQPEGLLAEHVKRFTYRLNRLDWL